MPTTPTAPITGPAWAGAVSSFNTQLVNRMFAMRDIKLSDGTQDPVTSEYNITEELSEVVVKHIDNTGIWVVDTTAPRFIPYGELVGFSGPQII